MNKDLEKLPIKSLLISYSVPALIGSVINLLYTIIDRIFVGQKLGADALAGVTLTFPVNQITFAISALIGVGSSTLISIRMGQDKNKEISRILGNQLAVFFLFSLSAIFLLEFFLKKILISTGGNEEILSYGIIYGSIIIPVLFSQCYSYGLTGVIRAFGFPKFIMITSSLGALLNIVLDYTFLYPLNMGIAGAAWATLLSNSIAALLNLVFLFSKGFPVKLNLRDFRISFAILCKIFKFGTPSTVITLGNALVIGLFNNQLNRFGGSKAIAAYGVFMTVHTFVLMTINGVSHGGMPPILGYNIGAKRYDRVLETIKLSLTYCLLVSIIFMILIQLFPQLIMKLFISNRETIDIGVEALRYGFFTAPVMISTIVIANFYQALGEARLTIIFNLIRKVIFIIPAILFLPDITGLKGIWLSRPIADTVTLIIIGPYFIKTIRTFYEKDRLKKNEILEKNLP